MQLHLQVIEQEIHTAAMIEDLSLVKASSSCVLIGSEDSFCFVCLLIQIG